MKNEIPRRQFLRDSALAAGAVALTATAGARPAADSQVERFQIDIDRYRKVDPALVRYECVQRFTAGKPEARRLAAGPEKRLYASCATSVTILDDHGCVVTDIPTTAAVRAVAVTGEGDVFAAVKDHIEVFDSKKKRTAKWDAPAGRPLLTGIAVSANDVFVADAGNRIVWRYDRSGRLMRRIGEKDEHRNIPGFVIPSPFFDVEVGADHLLRVTNPGRHKVETYTFDGELELSWGKPGAAIDAFCGCCNPCNIELLPDGRVVTFEKGLPRVKIFSATGTLECVVAGPTSFSDPAKSPELIESSYGGLDGAIDSSGRIYVLDLINAEIQVFAPKASGSIKTPAA